MYIRVAITLVVVVVVIMVMSLVATPYLLPQIFLVTCLIEFIHTVLDTGSSCGGGGVWHGPLVDKTKLQEKTKKKKMEKYLVSILILFN